MNIFDIILHFDQYLNIWAQSLGVWLYVILFLIVFAETGLVVAPFLPGDSLLFALGALTSISVSEESTLSFGILSVLLVIAAFIGDNVNYQIGKFFGPKIFYREKSIFLNRSYLEKTQNFYARHGAKAVVLARFAPIARTFVPFVAGVGRMHYPKYLTYSLGGAILWTQIFLWAGRIFGDLPVVKRNFHIVIFAVIGISLLPMLVGWLQSRRTSAITPTP